MNKGMRVVKIALSKDGRPIYNKPLGKVNPKPVAVSSSVAENGPENRVVTLPAPSTACSHHTPLETHTHLEVPHIPFRNPDLNDQPLHWSPRMFKPEIDRHNWTWSDWDSPSRDIEDVSYQTENWPIHDPIARLPPLLRDKLRAILAMRPDNAAVPSAPSPVDLSADTVREEVVDFMSSFSSHNSTRPHAPSAEPARSEQSIHSESSDFSSWVDMDVAPWPRAIIEVMLDDPRLNPHLKERVMPDFSPLSSHSASSLDASIHSKSSEFSSWVEVDGIPKQDAQKPQSLISNHENNKAKFKELMEAGRRERLARTAEAGTHNRVPEHMQDLFGSKLFDSSTSSESSTLSKPSTRPEPKPLSARPSRPNVRIPEHMQDLFGSKLFDSSSSSESSTHSGSGGLPATHERPHNRIPEPTFDSGSDESINTQSLIYLGSSTPSEGSEPSVSGRLSAIREHFHSLPQRTPSPSVEVPSDTALQPSESHTAPIRQLLSTPPPFAGPPEHFHTLRQLPSAIAMEPRQSSEEPSRGTGFGWKSLACVAVTAAAVGAGLAYAWFSG